jgi:tripartite-type tricarboxylate transporter receptor subunit TctC
MKRGCEVLKLLAGLCLVFTLTSSPGSAETSDNFYKGKTITAIVGYGPGGGFDVLTRIVAQYMGKYIPGNPNVIVQNMPGAGSLLATNYLYSLAPKDGTMFGLLARNMPMIALLGHNSNVRFDPRQFTWLGSSSDFSGDAYVLIARKDAPAKSAADLRRSDRQQTVIGGTAEGSGSADVPKILREALNLNFKLVLGYRDSAAMNLAMENGEIAGRTGELSSFRSVRPDWLKPDSDYRLLVQYARVTRLPDFPDVPTARELAPNEDARELIEFTEAPLTTMSWPFAAPPGIPPERAKILQDAFAAVHRDPQFLAEAAGAGFDIDLVTPEGILNSINKMAQVRPEVLDNVRSLIGGADKTR